MNDFTFKYLLIWSNTPDELMKFYQDFLELEMIEKTDIPATNEYEKDYGYDFKLGDNNILWIGHHSEVKEYNSDPLRHMINLNTEKFDEWVEKLEKHAKVKIIAEPTITPFSNDKNKLRVVTFLDPEGNCLQLFGASEKY